jgi:hypothetical protein
MSQYYWVWGIVLVVLGLFLAFFGNKFVNAVIYIIATAALFLIVSNLFFTLFLEKVKTKWVQWTIVGVIFVAANLVAFVLIKFRRWAVAALAAFGGALVGILLSSTFAIGSAGGYYGIVIGMAVVFFIVTFFIEQKMIIFITSFVGSYCLIRGISVYAGGFPNEIQLHDQIA